jgi:hypothetical protein
MMRERNLPWQYTFLALIWIFGVFGGGIFWVFAKPREYSTDLLISIAYLIIAGVLTPVLISSGRRVPRQSRWDGIGEVPSSSWAQAMHTSRTKGMMISAIVIVLGCIVGLAMIAGMVEPAFGGTIAGALIVIGIIKLIRHGIRND